MTFDQLAEEYQRMGNELAELLECDRAMMIAHERNKENIANYINCRRAIATLCSLIHRQTFADTVEEPNPDAVDEWLQIRNDAEIRNDS